MTAEVLRIQGRVLLALMLRETRTRYGRRQLGYIWALLEPLLHITFLSVLFSFLGRQPALGDSLVVFMATGLATYVGFRNVLNRTRRVYGSNENLLSFPVVKLFDIFLARALLELATWIVVSFILLGGLILIGWGPLPRDFIMMFSAVLALFFLGFGGGMVLGILAQFFPWVGTLLRIPFRLLYFLSGIFYLPDRMAPALRDILSWNPVLHGITLFRMGYYENYDSFVFDREYLMGWIIGCLFMGLLATRVARKPLRNLQ